MRKVILYIANSLDNFIARENGDVDWLFVDGDYEMKKFYSSVDTVIMGRKTIEKGNELGQTHYKDKKNYVFSRTLKDSDIDELEYVCEDLKSFVNRIKAESGKDIWLVGGGNLIRQFLENDLIDEIYMFVHPVLLGKGLPLFLPFTQSVDLKLIETKEFSNGVVKLRYSRP